MYMYALLETAAIVPLSPVEEGAQEISLIQGTLA